MTDRLRVTELDFDEIKTNLKNFLKNQNEFTDYDFEGSGLSVLLDILAYNTHYNAYYLNMIANESFLDTALLRNSVVSHAKKFGYIPRSSTAARAIVNFTVNSLNSTPGSLTLPKGYTFISSLVDNKIYKFVTLDDVTVSKVGTNFTFQNLKIYEGSLNRFSFTHSESSNPKQIFTIPDENIDISTLKVSVQQSVSNTNSIVYNLATDVINLTSNSNVYFLQEGLNSQYQIYFGDDVIGKKIPDGGVVNVTYLSTNGSIVNKANNFIATTPISSYTTFTVQSVSSASGGSEKESVDQIKFSAPLQFISQNRAVTKNDYVKIIQQKYPQFDAVNVWGGEENIPPVYGKVFISTLQSKITTAINSFSNLNLNKFNSIFSSSKLRTNIDNSDVSVVSNELEIFLSKRFRPILSQTNTYILDFGVELSRGTTLDNFYSSPTFTVLDENLVERNCFIEEVPSSFTGVETISVITPGSNYTTTPTVEIVGDGRGAKGVAIIVNGKLNSVKVTNPGIGYTTAAIRIIGGGGSGASAEAVLENRFGKIRLAYFKPDEVTSKSTKVVLNSSKDEGVTGTIDYILGKITIDNFSPLSIDNDFDELTINVRPKSTVLQSIKNKMLAFDETDPTSVVVELKTI